MPQNIPGWMWLVIGIILVLVMFMLLGHPIKIT